MEKIYLILAHNAPVHLERLIHRLRDGASFFIVQIDAKAEFQQFKFLKNLPHVQCVTERENVLWADISGVSATLKCIEIALSNHKQGTVILLSGADYLVKSNEQIDRYLSRNAGKVFMDTHLLQSWKEGESRERNYKVNLSENRGDSVRLPQGLSRLLLSLTLRGKIGLLDALRIATIKRKLHISFCAGSQWWAMDIARLKEMMAYIDENFVALMNHYRHSFCPDEAFFQTVAMHLWGQSGDVILPSLTYHRWAKPGNPSPIVWSDSAHLEELRSLPDRTLFARKFGENSRDLLDALDALHATGD